METQRQSTILSISKFQALSGKDLVTPLPLTSSKAHKKIWPAPQSPSRNPSAHFHFHPSAHTPGVTQTHTLSKAQGGFLHLSGSIKCALHPGWWVWWCSGWEWGVTLYPVLHPASFLQFLLLLLAFIHSPWLRPPLGAP